MEDKPSFASSEFSQNRDMLFIGVVQPAVNVAIYPAILPVIATFAQTALGFWVDFFFSTG